MQNTNKRRLDSLLVERGLCTSRNQAQGLILAGKVRVNGSVIEKAGQLFDAHPAKTALVLSEKPPYVSRGGVKLAHAIHTFNTPVANRICIDIGASTGGFTDCLLQQGAAHVFAVDVGYGQLDWTLRQDSRVTAMEKTNIRSLTGQQLPQRPSLAVVDVSFISLVKVFPAVAGLLADTSERAIITLLKPQFEYRDYFPKGSFDGVVRDSEAHRAILLGVIQAIEQENPVWRLDDLTASPLKGPEGNREFLLSWLAADTGEANRRLIEDQINQVLANDTAS